MDDLITALELLRERHRFPGYIHVKLVAGAQAAQIERLTALATRVSVNLEAPCGADPCTDRAREEPAGVGGRTSSGCARWCCASAPRVRDGRPSTRCIPTGVAGMTMQFVVGATPDSDRTLIEHGRRGSRPAGDPPRPLQRLPPHRGHADGVGAGRAGPARAPAVSGGLPAARLRLRGDEVVFDADGNLPLTLDPKTAWALAHPERFPVEVTRADYETLVRVPGIGPVAARRLVTERGGATLRGAGRSPHARRGHDAGGRIPHAARPAAADHALDRAARLLGAGGRRRGGIT